MPTIIRDSGIVVQKPDEPPAIDRSPIVNYIYERLGPDLAAYYHDAVISSVGTECYDRDWTSDTRPKINKYVSGLVDLFLKEHTQPDTLVRCTMLLSFGSAQQKAQLMQLLYPETAVPGNVEEQPQVSEEEREQIIALHEAGTPRREMCAALGKGKAYYSVVKAVLDEYEGQA